MNQIGNAYVRADLITTLYKRSLVSRGKYLLFNILENIDVIRLAFFRSILQWLLNLNSLSKFIPRYLILFLIGISIPFSVRKRPLLSGTT